MDIQLCNDNNDSSKRHSTENTPNDDVCNDSARILKCDEPFRTEKMTDLDEFEQILSEYTEQQRNSDNNTDTTSLKTRNKSIATETIIEIGIDLAETANNVNNCNTREVDVNTNEVCTDNSEKPDMNKTLPLNNTQDTIIKEETLQCIETEEDIVSLSSDEVIVDETYQNLDLNALTNIFDSNHENKSIKIEVDIKNEITDDLIINNSLFEKDFAKAGPSGLNITNFEIDDIELCENSSINDINTTIDLTDSPNISLLELDNADARTIHTVTNDISIIEKIYFENGDNETKYIHISDNESDGSFHSSDFELITEDEAKMDGLIINFRQRNGIINDRNAYNNENIIDMVLPGPSDDYAYRENHRIPEGDEFFNMFHGIYAPANIPDLIFLENKSVVPSKCMNVDSDNFGFDLAVLNKEVFDEEYQEEAKETAKKILNSYHDDNEGRPRRRRPL